ncbi:acetolactate decarboxylase [Photobacterium iliopiscarium]|jgi:acetolactate decarboxylase|uniref:acetolactate decarboxylase n=1 Tax=Photobacterium iliopiscarium TaxID=56192 RepID=UPI000D155965|nr:acetolactate decarboxylase [Photobacterium iliopiscarium]PST94068.1 acetolactate decarboxylase [Photobacterium iliopiscarium]
MSQQPNEKTFYQTSMMSALIAGLYQGDFTIGQLLDHGNFGIGTFNDLDGEMIVLGDEVYQLTSTGEVHLVNHDITTPFASVVNFEPTEKVSLIEQTKAEFETCLENDFVANNAINAIRLTGKFSYVKTRTVPAQHRPYPPMVEVVKHQPIAEMTHISGVMIGFKIPEYMIGINVPGFHFHFISDDRTQGGHVSDFILTEGTAEVEIFKDFHLRMPASQEFDRADLNPDDLKAAIHTTEK